MKTNYLKLKHDSMRNIKLVIGNGFDLTCGLKSSYASFFEFSQELYNSFNLWIENKTSISKDLSIWDLIFFLLKNTETKFKTPELIDWKDVENVIKLTLGFQSNNYLAIDINLDRIYSSFKDDKIFLNEKERIIKNYFSNKVFNHKIEYYQYLLNELEIFENRFSKYLQSQMNEEYQSKAKKLLTLDGLLSFNRNELNSIDTFNYTTPEIFNELSTNSSHFKVRHINGTIWNSIFGIDSQDVPINDPRYIFTKSYRKMIRLAYGDREDHNRHFDNVVIYGHSLTEADYSYFFSILDKLELNKYDVYKKRLIIAFNNFKEDVEKEIAINTIKLLDAYDKWKNPNSNRHGLIEVLETSDRIGFVKIDTSNL